MTKETDKTNLDLPECEVCGGKGYYEVWKHDYGTEVRRHKCPCRIPNYKYPACPALGIKAGEKTEL